MKTAIVLPYFGKFDTLFPLWLKSCEINKDIIWFIFTDDKRKFDIPDNVRVYYMSFEDLRRKIQSLYDFKISLDNPYRLCNFKPAYGDIFRPYLEGFDRWGYCDNDLIFGELSIKMGGGKTQIGLLGHLTILPLNEEAINVYKYKEAYKIAFASSEPLFFDEVTFNKILDINGYKKESIRLANFVPRKKNFYIDYEKEREWINQRHVFLWHMGKLFRYYIDKNGIIVREEYAYIHFLKRPMAVDKELDFNKPIAIVPNRIYNISIEELNADFILRNNRPGIFWKYWRNSFKPVNLFKRIYYRLYQNKLNLRLINEMNQVIRSDEGAAGA